MTWESYIRGRFSPSFQPEVWRVVLCYELLRMLERDRLLALLRRRRRALSRASREAPT